MQAISTARQLDWQGWLLGIWSAIVSGGAGAIGGGTGAIIIDPANFNVLQGGGMKLLALMGIAFGFSAIFSLAKFLQIHPIPEYEQIQEAEARGFIRGADAVADAVKSDEAKP